MRTLLLALTTCLLVLPVQAKYSGGSGTAQDPYRIATAADLIALGETPGDYGKHFILTADLDLDPNLPGRKVFDKAVIAPDTEPAYEFQGTPFTAVFEGKGHTISHLTIVGADYLGLFGKLTSGAEVRDLAIVDVNMTGSGDCVGGLVGYNSGTVTQCYSTGAVSGSTDVGGLVGQNDGTVTQCYGTDVVSGSCTVGGLVGYNNGAVIQCYSAGAVSGDSEVGGLVGSNGHSPFLHPDLPWYGTVTQCYSTAEVTGDEAVGGLLGSNYEGTVTDCHSAGAVSGNADVGGLLGYVWEEGDAVVTNSFWDTQTSGQTQSAGGTGKTTAEMQDPNTFMAAGWDFVGQADGPNDIWAVPQGGGYPILWWQLSPWPNLPRFSGGTGEPNDPYRISTARDLNSIGHNPRLMKCHFKMVDDIDLTGLPCYPIGDYDYPYGGVFDGKGHTISHLTIKGESYSRVQ